MDRKIEITNREWATAIEKINSNTEQIGYIKKKTDNHENRIHQIEESELTLPISIQESITKALLPLNQKNDELQEKIIILENQKYKNAYDSIVKIVWAILGTGITVFVGYIINNLFS